MKIEFIIIFLLITVIGLLLLIVLRFKEKNESEIEINQNTALNELKSSIEIFKDAYGEKSTELSRNISEMYTLITKGGSKTQGQFGEISLKLILENAGFKEGVGFAQQQKTDSQIPDFTIFLPEARKIIIDSKVSLTDYSKFLAAQTDEERSVHKKGHIQSIRRHIKSLSETEYRAVHGNDSLDLIIMFMNVEGAYIIACEDKVVNEALRSKIAIVGPTTLIAILQIISRTWNNKKQSEDTQKIINNATAVYESAVLVSESFVNFSDLHDKSRQKIEEGRKRARNLVNKIENMRTIGGLEPKKETPVKLRSINKDQ